MKKVLLLHPDEGLRTELKNGLSKFEIVGGSTWEYPWWEHRKEFEHISAIALKDTFEPGRYAYFISRMMRNDGYTGFIIATGWPTDRMRRRLIVEGCDYVLSEEKLLEKLQKELEEQLPLGKT